MRLKTIFFEPMLAPPGPIQPQEVRESGTICSPSPTGTPSMALTCCGVSSLQASPATGVPGDAAAPAASTPAATIHDLLRATRTTGASLRRHLNGATILRTSPRARAIGAGLQHASGLTRLSAARAGGPFTATGSQEGHTWSE